MSIIIENVSFSYGRGSKAREVLHNVSFAAEQGEVVALLGANGVGKSTLIKCILGLLPGYTGSIKIDGEEASGLPAGRLARKIAYIPQLHYPAFNYSVLDMVLMGTGTERSVISSPGSEQQKKAYEALERLGIRELADRDYTHLSGGEQQLVLMARALVQKAGTWILDEPVANLDFGNQIMVQEQLVRMSRDGHTILMSTHNPEQSYIYADKIVALKDGGVLAAGSPGEVINSEMIRQLYNIDVTVESLQGDYMRVCVPRINNK